MTEIQGETPTPFEGMSALPDKFEANPSSLRRFLLRLAMDTYRPDEVLSAACLAVAESTGRPCSFIECEFIPKAAPGHVAVPVFSDGTPFGALIVERPCKFATTATTTDLQEIADLVGLAMMNARQAEAAAELQSDSEDILFHAPDAIFVASSDDVVRMANRRVLDFVNAPMDEIVGRTISALLDAGDVNWKSLAAAARENTVQETELSGPAGRRLVSLAPSFVADEPASQILCVMRDITAERQSHLAIRRTERSMLMGQVVEYLLHEVNNPLSALRVNLEQARKRVREATEVAPESYRSTASSERSAIFEKIERCLMHAGRCTERIRETMSVLRANHLGGDRPQCTLVDPGYEITLALSGLEQEYNPFPVRIVREDRLHSKISAVPLTIAEALGALIRNSIQALEGRADGRVEIAAVESQTDFRITVTDNGPGIPPESAARIFMPFFTTKPLGANLGLGLTMVEDSLRRSGGSICLLPNSTRGACFEIRIPKQQQ